MNLTCPDLLPLRRLVLPLWLLGTVLLAAPALAAPLLLDRIVAVVNTSVITQNELAARVAQAERQLALRKTPAPPRNLLERQLLERMITEKVLLQVAEETNIRIDGNTLDRAIGRIAAQNGMEPAAFRAALAADGVEFEEFRRQIRGEMTIARLKEREADSKVLVTDAEIDSYLAGISQEPGRQAEYALTHILVLAPEAAAPEQLQELRAKAEKALAELRAGASFAQVSAAYSDAQNALQGGDMGWRAEAKLPALFTAAIKDLNVGDVTPVLRSANGFHILKLLDKRGSTQSYVVRQTQARHILIKTNEVFSDQDAFVRLMELRDRVKNGGKDFGALAHLHSNDISASKNGDLGWINPGDTVPPFEQALDALAVGEISEPVRSPFGWHLIQVLARRDQDLTQERQRLEARRALRERKSEESFDDWVRQARDRAYVEYRLEE